MTTLVLLKPMSPGTLPVSSGPSSEELDTTCGLTVKLIFPHLSSALIYLLQISIDPISQTLRVF